MEETAILTKDLLSVSLSSLTCNIIAKTLVPLFELFQLKGFGVSLNYLFTTTPVRTGVIIKEM